MSFRVLDLFSGIGGFSLGLERTGMQTIAFCEINPFCRDVLRKHWPDIPCHDDITTRQFREDEADIICGGFPCQDISGAGNRAGITGPRSGLWRELVRAIRLVRPQYAIVENVAALLNRGMGTVLGDLAEIGNDAEWNCIPASALGAPHRRDRIWIVAHPRYAGCQGRRLQAGNVEWRSSASSSSGQDVADAACERWPEARPDCQRPQERPASGGHALADPNQPRLSVGLSEALGVAAGHPESERQDCPGREWWAAEPDVGRVANGVPARVDRLGALGNAVVPPIPEIHGRAIMASQCPEVVPI